MEAAKLFHWFIAVYLPTIGAHNHMGLILEALFLPTFFCNDWSFLYLFVTEGRYYLVQFTMNYLIDKHYIIILHKYYMLKYYQGLSLVSLNRIWSEVIPLLPLICCHHQNILFILYKYYVWVFCIDIVLVIKVRSIII